jgi:cytoskeletal protein RodZ
MGIFGDTLRQSRAHKGVSLKEAEHATRINRHHLAALEEENFGALPPLIYQRGIVRNYATYLDLDVNKLLSMFEEARGIPEDTELVAAMKPLDMPNHWAPNFAIIAFLVVMSAIVFAWLYSAYFAPSDAVPTAPEIVATVTPVSNDQLVMPTETPVPPSPTPKPTSTPKPTEEPPPTAAPTDPPVEETAPEQDALAAEAPSEEEFTPEESVAEESVAEEPASEETTGTYTFSFVADSDLELTVEVDGVTQFSGYLPAGDSTGFLSGDHFAVYTSDAASTQIVREDGSSFYMGDSFFELP